MPAVIEQVNKMSAEEKLRLIAYIVEYLTKYRAIAEFKGVVS